MDQWAVVCCDANCVLWHIYIYIYTKTKTHANKKHKVHTHTKERIHYATSSFQCFESNYIADCAHKYTVYINTHVSTPTGMCI